MSVHQPQTAPASERKQNRPGAYRKPERLHHIPFETLGEIEDIFVSTNSYLENLALRTDSKEDILRTAALMLMDKENITRQYIDDYLAFHHIENSNVLEVSAMDLLIEFTKIVSGGCLVIPPVRGKKSNLQEGTLVEIPFPLAYPQTGNRFCPFGRYSDQSCYSGIYRLLQKKCLKTELSQPIDRVLRQLCSFTQFSQESNQLSISFSFPFQLYNLRSSAPTSSN